MNRSMALAEIRRALEAAFPDRPDHVAEVMASARREPRGVDETVAAVVAFAERNVDSPLDVSVSGRAGLVSVRIRRVFEPKSVPQAEPSDEDVADFLQSRANASRRRRAR